ncbi:winged helix-turn-helix transcriptional regulator [Methanomicrobium antiquum]|uniref:Winged helix-turn-helix transcriptional regulator n=1 Tax=Methanomicrobium antiquum TaxID=487686 RepID=A0AAF0FQR7_9EURY|nr:winged helix-turn-helix transcriptional regulator [Methanomicrobium antiquum]WFN36271.1 winged helix-turn-helix transcriptional regulator [Methanomicrobium antiquum]
MGGIIRIFILFSVFLAFTVPGIASAEYIVKSHEDNTELIEKGFIDSAGADTNITFWDLPLWIKISFIAGILAAGMGIIKLIPAIIGRITDPLENGIRQEIFEYISENPGCTITDLSDNLDLNRSSTKYHILKLKFHKIVNIHKTEKHLRLFKNSATFNEHQRMTISLLKNKTGRMLLISILENPGITNGELARKHNMNKSTIHWHINKFLETGAINYIPEGKLRRYYLTSSFENSIRVFLEDGRV